MLLNAYDNKADSVLCEGLHLFDFLGDHIVFVIAGETEQNIGVLGTDFRQQVGSAAVAIHETAIQVVGQFIDPGLVLFDKDHLAAGLQQSPARGNGNPARADENAGW